MNDITQKPWWSYLETSQQDLLLQSQMLLVNEKVQERHFTDYSFIVFPAAKAYEGFLKKLFFDLGFINEAVYQGDRFRIGKALNPSLEKEWRHESIYDKLADFCQGSKLPDQLWQAWKNSRNSVFHFWPNHHNLLSLEEAEARVAEIIAAISAAFAECKI
ncbi:hypothetical protein HY404_02945 [Candidatus Microgenomates bacterium]|nr:hypothetical protein [Candidatus Microgenomates bacterium]